MAQKVCRRMWSVRGMGTMARAFYRKSRGTGNGTRGTGLALPTMRIEVWLMPLSRAPCLKTRGFYLFENDDFTRTLEAELLDHARAIGRHVVHDFV